MAEQQFSSLVSLFVMLFVVLIGLGVFFGYSLNSGRSKNGDGGNSFGKILGIGFLILVGIIWLAMPGTGDGIVQVLQGLWVEMLKPLGWFIEKATQVLVVAAIAVGAYLLVRYIVRRRA